MRQVRTVSFEIWEDAIMKEWLCEEVPAVTVDGKVISTMLHQLREIVRCRDCKYYLPLVHSCQHLPATVANPEGFCSDGERREESDE